MNTSQAKKLPLKDILAKLGLQPVKSFKGGVELAYLSPFRKETEPSLFVNIRKNLWNDFGDIGGNALDFVIRYQNTNVKGALEFLEGLFGNGFVIVPTSNTYDLENPSVSKESVFLLERALAFGTNAPSLVSYITGERKINPDIATMYLKEIHFTNRETGKAYFAVGFENLSGGYEIRNPFFKSSLGAKNMSLVEGQGASHDVWVFEGFLDFLSILTLIDSNSLPSDCLILNSVSYAENAIQFIKSKGYTGIKGFLDNDRAGDETTFKLQAEFGFKLLDLRSDYHEFKDVNDFLTQKHKLKSSVSIDEQGGIKDKSGTSGLEPNYYVNYVSLAKKVTSMAVAWLDKKNKQEKDQK